jgi:hypothetical protein
MTAVGDFFCIDEVEAPRKPNCGASIGVQSASQFRI